MKYLKMALMVMLGMSIAFAGSGCAKKAKPKKKQSAEDFRCERTMQSMKYRG